MKWDTNLLQESEGLDILRSAESGCGCLQILGGSEKITESIKFPISSDL